MSLPSAAVLMSTYNGEKYLREQIESILAQKNVDLTLYIRDDGSRDKTLDIIHEYEKTHDNVKLTDPYDHENLGVKSSFLTLLQHTLQENTSAAYFAFADQDDYWKEEKLERAISLIESKCSGNKPSLYYSNKTFADQDLNVIREENIKYYGDFFEGFYRSLAFGCTMVFDRKMAELSISHMPVCDCYHDAWIYRVAKCIGADIVFDSTAYILYRQHGKNVIGAKECTPAQNRWWNIFRKREHKLQIFYREIYENYSDHIRDPEKKYIEMLVSYNKSVKTSLELAFDPLAKKRGIKSNILWTGKVFFHTI